MKKNLLTSIGLLPFITACGGTETVEKPNILFVLVDDLGKEWISGYGAEDVETPVFDELLKTGMLFQNCYSMPQSTPSRMTLLTGQYPCTHGWVNHWDVPRWGAGCRYDETRNPSLGLSMKGAGYVTAVAGKWQLNDFRLEPDAMNRHGFDEYCMWTGGEGGNEVVSDKRYWDPYIHTEDGSRTYEGRFGEDVFSDFLINFMKKHKDDPMFIYYPMTLTHTPFTSTPHEPEVTGKYDCHKAMVRYMDYTVGKLVRALDELGIRDRTLIFLTTDNGTTGQVSGHRNGVLVKGGKMQCTENGTAMPFVVNCPALVKAGQTDALVDFSDFMPTFLELGGGTYPASYRADGHSFAGLLTGKAEDSDREWIMSMGGDRTRQGITAGVTYEGRIENCYRFRDRVVRDKRYKIYISPERKAVQLFDLQEDPWETENLIASTQPEHVAAVEKLMRALETFPPQDADPQYTPSVPQTWDSRPAVHSQVWKK